MDGTCMRIDIPPKLIGKYISLWDAKPEWKYAKNLKLDSIEKYRNVVEYFKIPEG